MPDWIRHPVNEIRPEGNLFLLQQIKDDLVYWMLVSTSMTVPRYVPGI